MTTAGCRHRSGMPLWQDLVYTEVCDPETYRPVPYGSEGTPVYTHLERTSQPMIRLVSGARTRGAALRASAGWGGEFRIIVPRREAMDELLVRAEFTAEHEPPERRDTLRA